MNTAGNIANTGLSIAGPLLRLLPEPVSRLGSAFRSIFAGVSGSGASGAGGFGGGGSLGLDSGFADQIDPGYRELLQMQIEAQKQLTLVSMASNIEKSKHETEMAAIRNIRVG